MSKYYNANKTRNLFDPAAPAPFKLSRSKIDLFLNCPRCFYLDRRLGIGQPPGFPFSLNSAVDKLLKKEFDFYREKGEAHPLMKAKGINAVPFKHERMDEWRDALKRGVQFHHKATNLLITGGVDDVWVTPNGELIIVDYKATSKTDEVNIDADWQIGYRRQMDIYAWLFKQNGFKVFHTGYFVYCNGRSDRPRFDQKLEFDISLLPYTIDDSWVEAAIHQAKVCLASGEIPAAGDDCDYCKYVQALSELP